MKASVYLLILALSVCGVAVSYAQQTAKQPPAARLAYPLPAPAPFGQWRGHSLKRIDMLVKAQAAQGRPESPELVAAVKDQLVLLELVSQEAAKKGSRKSTSRPALPWASSRFWLMHMYKYVKNSPVAAAAEGGV
jgi:peptidyl-prolyl cis-trans isomerase C